MFTQAYELTVKDDQPRSARCLYDVWRFFLKGERMDNFQSKILAQLDWPVIKLSLNAGSKHIPVPDKFAVVRKTGNLVQKADPVLGVVGKDYTPLQNRDAFRFCLPPARCRLL